MSNTKSSPTPATPSNNESNAINNATNTKNESNANNENVIIPKIFGKYVFDSMKNYDRLLIVNYSDVDLPITGYSEGFDDEELIIEELSDHNEVEEINISYQRSQQNLKISRAYQLGKWNIERFEGDKKPMVGSIVFVIPPNNAMPDASLAYEQQTETFTCKRFVIVRYGTFGSFESTEKFTLSEDGKNLEVVINYRRGKDIVNDVKIFRKVESEVDNQNESMLKSLPRTLGWLSASFHSKNVIDGLQIKYIDSFGIKGVDYTNLTGLQSLNATPTDYQGGSSVLRRIGGRLHDSDEFVVLRFRITYQHLEWDILHRFKEFDALKLFLTSYSKVAYENEEEITETPASPKANSTKQPAFPTKRTLSKSASVSIQRGQGLEAYLKFHLEQGYTNPVLINTLCSFFEVS